MPREGNSEQLLWLKSVHVLSRAMELSMHLEQTGPLVCCRGTKHALWSRLDSWLSSGWPCTSPCTCDFLVTHCHSTHVTRMSGVNGDMQDAQILRNRAGGAGSLVRLRGVLSLTAG